MIARLKSLAETETFQQAWRFLACGGAATVLQYSVLALLVDVVRAPEVPSSVFAYLCGTIATYLLNRRFTFKTIPPFWLGLAKLLPLNLIGLGINTAIFAALFHYGFYYLLAQACATGLVSIYNYTVARFIVFRT